MIPAFDKSSKLLPPGQHAASWREVQAALGFSEKRKKLLVGLLKASRELAAAGATHLIIDGSFSTKKYNPRDFDCCYDASEVDNSKLHSSFFDFTPPRKPMKERFGGELFPSTMIADRLSMEPFSTYFQHTADGIAKGIIVLDLSTLP
jgi:hypothetical protein